MLNIVTHPHSLDGYVQLFQDATKHSDPKKPGVSMGGDQRAMLGTCFPIGADPHDGLAGSIFRFTELDMDGPWLDAISGKELEPDQVYERVNVPDGLKPNLSIIWYNFFPRTHKLVFETERNDPTTKKTTSFSASTARKFFSLLFSGARTTQKFTSVEITVIQSKETLNAIFRLPFMKTLEIVINRPNSTDGTFEEEIERQLEEEKATLYKQQMQSKEQDGLKPSERTRALAKLALSNGYVEASGIDREGEKTHMKTIVKPVEQVTYYDPQQGFGLAFNEAALTLVESQSS